MATIMKRSTRASNFIQWQDYTIVYRRYASLFMIICCDPKDNELLMLEFIQFFIELLDLHFGDVCELDLIFCFDQAYQILDELVMAGEIQESSKRAIRKAMKEAFIPIDKEEQSNNVDDLFNIFG